MSLLSIRVELPPYSTAFDVILNEHSLVADLKQEISRQCPGHPGTDGQRLIYRGRVLHDKERSGPRVVHLAVHPSAWTSTPPQVSLPPSHKAQPVPSPTGPSPMNPPNTITPRMHFSFPAATPSQSPFILYKHQEALAALSPAIRAPTPLLPQERHASYAALRREGWQWPSELDAPYPPFTPGGLQYDYTLRSGQPYLSLRLTGEQPTPRQLHALAVLSATFTILSLPPAPTPTIPASQSQNLPVPPHVNQLLQQLGLPPVRGNHNGPGPNPDLIPNPNNPGVEIRRIRLQPLLAPLFMLTFRTVLLLYFFAPARKPVFGILILAWMLYELWQPIRNGLRGVDREANPENPAPLRQDPNPNPNNAEVPANAAGAPARLPAAPAIEQQAVAILDKLANMNIPEEQRILNEEPGAPTTDPTFGHKAMTFVTLLFSTLHPAIWDRRRVALRRREGVIRTEENIRNAPTSEDNEIQRNLRDRYERRPRWIRRYIQRVVAEEWIDDSD